MTYREILEASMFLIQANLERNDIHGALLEVEELFKALDEKKSDCSICRSRHGREIEHACE